jgi:serine/threonine-protein kinase
MISRANDGRKLRELLIGWEDARDRGETMTVEQLCRDCPELADELRREVAALRAWDLLEEDSSARSSGESEPAAPAPTRAPASARVTVELHELHLHARGGLGRIYKARQTGLPRDVALKFPREERAHDRESVARFLREAAITARLEHPGIVPIYGMGRDEDGNPCYAMRFIQGTTLDQALKAYHAARTADRSREPMERDRSFRGLLQRFKAACTTVAYAHSRGVLHRDLKPANIMLGPFEETLVVDWGLGKIFGADAAPSGDEAQAAGCPPPESEEIETCGAIGTPGFMSPEQHAGRWDQVGPASDVYSLGATLYVVLTGKSPFRGCARAEVAARVQQGKFTPPRQANPDVPRALEAVCLKAMALEPEDRYASALHLAGDVENWLAGEPVSAWREPWTTRVRRGMARHRTLVTTGVVVALLAMPALGLFAAYQRQSNQRLAAANRDLEAANRRAEQARGRAEDHLALALRAIEHFHQSVSQHLDVKNRPDLKPLRQDLLQAPLEFYRQLKQDLQDNAVDHPEAAARYAEAVAGLAQITALIGAEPDAIAAYQQAIEVLDRLGRQQPTVTQYRWALARAHYNLSLLQRATSRRAGALTSGERARSLCQGLLADHPAEEQYQLGLAEAENQLGLLHREERRPAAALVNYQQARERLQALVHDHPATTAYQVQLALVLSNLGVLQRAGGRIRDAQQSYEQALATFQGLVRSHPENVNHRSGLAKVAYNLGNLHGIELGQVKEAMAYLEQSRSVLHALVQENPSVGEYRAGLSKTCGQIGALLRISDPAGSLPNFERARELLQGLVRDHPEVKSYRADLAMTHYQIGNRQLYFRRVAAALASLEQARVLAEPLVREAPNDFLMKSQLGAILENRGSAMAAMGRSAEATAAYRQAISQARQAFEQAPASPRLRRELAMDLVHDHEGLAEALQSLNQPDEALRSLCAARAVLETLPDLQPSERDEIARLSSRAIALLRRLIAAGKINLQQWNNDRSLDPLRSRSDFQMLGMDLAFPADPFRDDRQRESSPPGAGHGFADRH